MNPRSVLVLLDYLGDPRSSEMGLPVHCSNIHTGSQTNRFCNAPSLVARLPMNSFAVRSTRTTDEDPERARRFRDTALPHLDAVYTLAFYLLRDPSDAEDALQECYLLALRHFNTLRSSEEAKPWPFAILRNVCRVDYERRSRVSPSDVNMKPDDLEDIPVWREPQKSPET